MPKLGNFIKFGLQSLLVVILQVLQPNLEIFLFLDLLAVIKLVILHQRALLCKLALLLHLTLALFA